MGRGVFWGGVGGLGGGGGPGGFFLFEGDFAIHDGAALTRTIFGPDALPEPGAFGRRNLLLYFKDDDIEAAFARLKDRVALIHPLEAQAWGQRVFRFHDPDGHVIEIGEPRRSEP